MYVMMMVIQNNILLSVFSIFVVGLWDGLDECEISRPDILSQSAHGYLLEIRTDRSQNFTAIKGFLYIVRFTSVHITFSRNEVRKKQQQ